MLGVQVTVNASAAKTVAEAMRPERLEKILIAALRKAMAPVVAGVRAAAPVGKTSVSGHHLAGQLKRSIRLRIDTRRGLRVAISGAPQGHLVEYGHRMVVGGRVSRLRTTRFSVRMHPSKVGQVVGQVAPHPFAGPVVNAAQDKIAQAVSDEVVKSLNQAARVSRATGIPL